MSERFTKLDVERQVCLLNAALFGDRKPDSRLLMEHFVADHGYQGFTIDHVREGETGHAPMDHYRQGPKATTIALRMINNLIHMALRGQIDLSADTLQDNVNKAYSDKGNHER